MYKQLRSTIRAVAPAPLVPVLARVENYFRRLADLVHVATHVRGATLRDNLVLWGSILAGPFTALTDLRKWREPTLLGDAEIVSRGLGRFTIRANSDDLAHVLFERDYKLHEALRSSVKPGDVALDAGANIGVTALTLSRAVGDSGRVIAVEMMPETAAHLRHHLALNGIRNVEVVELALSARAGETVTANVPAGFFGQASIAPETARSGSATIDVRTTTIDEILRNIPEVALVKMDLEGAERIALEGAEASLAKFSSVIFEDWAGGSRLSNYFVSKGFEITPVDEWNFLARRPVR